MDVAAPGWFCFDRGESCYDLFDRPRGHHIVNTPGVRGDIVNTPGVRGDARQ
jgi:hypothetical protein